jgi:hypothetical protein
VFPEYVFCQPRPTGIVPSANEKTQFLVAETCRHTPIGFLARAEQRLENPWICRKKRAERLRLLLLTAEEAGWSQNGERKSVLAESCGRLPLRLIRLDRV